MSLSELEKLKSKWFRNKEDCGCNKVRAKIKKAGRSFLQSQRKIAVMFSGGLDSTYAAWSLRNSGFDVTLYNVRWIFENPKHNNVQEFAATKAAAEKLGLPLEVLGVFRVNSRHCGNVMRIPTIASMLICHRNLRFDRLATGMAPSISERDYHWNQLLKAIATHCMPGMEIIHPRDGIKRSELVKMLPESLLQLIYSGPAKKDDGE